MEINLTFHGKYTSVWELQKKVREAGRAGERRVVYMARSANIADIYTKFGRTRAEENEEADRCGVAYVGITGAKDLGRRFGSKTGRQHHKIGDLAMTVKKLPPLTEFWAGYFEATYKAPDDGGRHEWRLLLAEDILISWFLPPLNTSGVQRYDEAEGVGSGSFQSAKIHFHWNVGGNGIGAGPAGFPKELHYNHSAASDDNRLVAYY